MAEISSNLFAGLARRARFLGPWRRPINNGNVQKVDLNRDFHLPRYNDEGGLLTSPTDIENFKEALFAVVMTMAHLRAKKMEESGEDPKKGVTVNLDMTFLDSTFHPETLSPSPGETLEDMGYTEISPPDDAESDARFFQVPDGSGPDTIILSLPKEFEKNAYLLNAEAIFRSGLAALACYDL